MRYDHWAEMQGRPLTAFAVLGRAVGRAVPVGRRPTRNRGRVAGRADLSLAGKRTAGTSDYTKASGSGLGLMKMNGADLG